MVYVDELRTILAQNLVERTPGADAQGEAPACNACSKIGSPVRCVQF